VGVLFVFQGKPYGFSAALLSRLASTDSALRGGYSLCGVGSLCVSKVVGTPIVAPEFECNGLLTAVDLKDLSWPSGLWLSSWTFSSEQHTYPIDFQ